MLLQSQLKILNTSTCNQQILINYRDNNKLIIINIINNSQMNPIKYITPRIGIVHNQYTTYYYQINEYLNKMHANYFHIFNLTNNDSLGQHFGNKLSSYKNRGYPYSMKQVFAICLLMDKYLKMKKANTVILLCHKNNQYSSFIIICYLFICNKFNNINDAYDYYHSKNPIQIPKLYFSYFQQLANGQSKFPIVKTIQSLTINPPLFIPTYQIHTSTRFQQFTLSYKHQIQKNLEQYYYYKNNQKYCQHKPITEYLLKPAIIYGDIIINLYRYETLKNQKILSVSLNTIFLQNKQSVTLKKQDFSQFHLNQDIELKINLAQYCFCTTKTPFDQKCFKCCNLIKTIKKQYSELQQTIEQFDRSRSREAATILCFGQLKFDDCD